MMGVGFAGVLMEIVQVAVFSKYCPFQEILTHNISRAVIILGFGILEAAVIIDVLSGLVFNFASLYASYFTMRFWLRLSW